jgi:transcriptional regulator with XRE-family HTH domain
MFRAMLCPRPRGRARARTRLALPRMSGQSIGAQLPVLASGRACAQECTRLCHHPQAHVVDVDHGPGIGQGRGMDGLDDDHDSDYDYDADATPLVADVGRALRKARRRRGLSQREFAQQLGVSKSRLARLESDAGPQSLEMVCQVLMASGFRLEVIDLSGEKQQADDALAAALLELCDARGRHFPAHLDAYPMGYPPVYWFIRNGGWNTAKAFPQWTYVRRFSPRRGTGS